MREKPPRQRKLTAGHRDGALMEIDAKRQFGRILDDAERLHVIRQRDVAKARALFGGCNGLVDLDRGSPERNCMKRMISPSVSRG
jgi:hypothetical protein